MFPLFPVSSWRLDPKVRKKADKIKRSRQMGGETDRWADRQEGKATGRQSDRQSHRYIDGWMDEWMDRYIGGLKEET